MNSPSAVVILFCTVFFMACQQPASNLPEIKNGNSPQTKNWKWPDSLDAVVAAPASHTILFEDSVVRILKVTVNPGQQEPVHAHRWRSLAWAARSSPFALYQFGVDGNNKLVLKDSFSTQLELNSVQNWKPEEPHSIKNIGNDTLILYRVEFKHD